MEIYILNRQYERIGIIDDKVYESLLWNKKYNDEGYCEIYVSATDELIQLLQHGYYVYRYDDNMFCQIKTVEITTDQEKGNYIIATAQDICTILSGRIVRWPIVFSGTVANFINQLLIDNIIDPAQTQRKISNFTVDTSNFSEFTETIETSVQCEDLLQLIKSTCKTYNYGFRVSYNINTSQLVFSLYKGENKASTLSETYVEFSPTFANIISSNYKEDETIYKNIAYVGYNNSNEEFKLLSVLGTTIEASGEVRKEFYIDATGTSRDITYAELLAMFPTMQKNTSARNYYIVVSGNTIIVATYEVSDSEEKITVTDYTYLLLLKFIGQNALATYAKTQEFTGQVDTIDTYEYKTDYDLGDIVKVVNEYGISAEARITEIMESDDTESKYQVEPKFEYN